MSVIADLESPAALALARLASMGSRIEPELLRALRFELLPEADVSAEADVWWSSAVDLRASDSIRFSPEVVDELHAGLSPERATAAYRVIQRVHRNAPRFGRLYEWLTFRGLVTPQHPAVTRALRALLGTLLHDADRKVDVGVWVTQTFRRLPRPLREQNPAYLAVVFAANSQRRGYVEPQEVPAAAAIASSWHPALRALGDIALDVRRDGDTLLLRPVEIGTSSSTLWVPATDPMLISVQSQDSANTALIARDGWTPVSVRGPVVEVVALDHRVYELRAGSVSTPVHARELRWLHLSDLQFRDAWTGPSLDAIARDAEQVGPIDVVFVTGDLTYDGNGRSLREVTRQLRELCALLPGRPRLFAVPGNHDLDLREYTDAKAIERWHADRKFREQFWEGRGHLYEQVQRGLAAWRDAFPAQGFVAGDFAETVELPGLRVGIVGLNNAFLHGFGRDPELAQDVGARQLAAVVPDRELWRATHDVRVLLTHFPPERMTQRPDARFDRLPLETDFHVHLTGSSAVREEQASVTERQLTWRGAGWSPTPGHWGPGYTIGHFEHVGARATISLQPRSIASREIRALAVRDVTIDVTPEPSMRDLLPENGKWVLVDGTDTFEISPEREAAAKELGAELASGGYSLITLGRKGVAHVVARSFVTNLRGAGYSSGLYRLLHVCHARPDYWEAGRHLSLRSVSEVTAALLRADALVQIGRSQLTDALAAEVRDMTVPMFTLENVKRVVETMEALGNSLSPPFPLFPPGAGVAVREAAHALDDNDIASVSRRVARIRDAASRLSREHISALARDPRPSARMAAYLSQVQLAVDDILIALKEDVRYVARCFRLQTLTLAFERAADVPQVANVFAAAYAVVGRRLGDLPEGEAQDLRDTLVRTTERVMEPDHLRRAGQLAAYAEIYETARDERLSRERTARLDQLVEDVAQLATMPCAPEAAIWFVDGLGEGARIVALSLIKGGRDAAGFPIVQEALERPMSAFEHYTALTVARVLVDTVDRATLDLLRDTVSRLHAPRGAIQRADRARWALVDDIMDAIAERDPQSPPQSTAPVQAELEVEFDEAPARAASYWLFVGADRPAPPTLAVPASAGVRVGDTVLAVTADEDDGGEITGVVGVYRAAERGSSAFSCTRTIALPISEQPPSQISVAAAAEVTRLSPEEATALINAFYPDRRDLEIRMRQVPRDPEPAIYVHTSATLTAAPASLEVIAPRGTKKHDIMLVFTESPRLRPLGLYRIESGRRDDRVDARATRVVAFPAADDARLDAVERDLRALRDSTSQRDLRNLNLYDRMFDVLGALYPDPDLQDSILGAVGYEVTPTFALA